MNNDNPPIHSMKYLHPKFSDRVHIVAFSGQVKFDRSGHAISVASNWASAQNMESTVSKYWCVPGKNSKKIAESTGKFPELY